jgi:hypothetical protein
MPSSSEQVVASRRRIRRHKLLPDLKLEYPTDDERRKLAELAKVDDSSQFGNHIEHVILDAHLNNLIFSGLSAPAIKETLQSLARKARQLAEDLRAIDVGSGRSAERAGQLLEYELSKFEFSNNVLYLLPQYISLFRRSVTPRIGRGPQLNRKRARRGLRGVRLLVRSSKAW